MGFFTTAVEQKQISDKLLMNPSLVVALARLQPDEHEIDEYAAKYLKAVSDNFLTIQILGAQGSGKSGIGQKLGARYARKPLTIDNISLHYPGFIEIVARLSAGEFALLDEQTKLHGVGSRRIADDIVNIIETLRQNGGSIIVISPTEKMLGVYDVHLTIEILGRDGERVLCAYKARTEHYLGAFICRLDWNSPLWLAYMEHLKRVYVQDAKELKFFKNDYERIAAKVMAHPDAALARKAGHWRLIMEKTVPNLTTDEKKLVLAQIQLQLTAAQK